MRLYSRIVFGLVCGLLFFILTFFFLYRFAPATIIYIFLFLSMFIFNIKLALYFSIFSIPLFFDIGLYSTFDLSKAALCWLIAQGVVLTYLIFSIIDTKKLTIYRSKLDMPIAAYLLVTIVATIFSLNPYMSLLGTYKRYEGLIAIVSYIIMYYAVVFSLRTHKDVLLAYKLVIFTAASSAIYGIIQHYGGDPLRWEFFDPYRVFATFGNPVFFSTYGLMSIFMAISLYCTLSLKNENKKVQQTPLHSLILWGILFALIYFGFFLTKTRSCFLGFGAAIIIFFILIRKIGGSLVKSYIIGFVCVALAITLYFNIKPETSVILRLYHTIKPAIATKLKESKVKKSLDEEKVEKDKTAKIFYSEEEALPPGHYPFRQLLSLRYYIWSTAATITFDNPKFALIGVGPDTLGLVYPMYLDRIYPAKLQGPIEYEDRVHNDIFDNTIARGILGLLTYIWLWVVYFIWCIRRRHQLSVVGQFLIVGLICAQIAYLVQNEFMFPMTPISHFYWVLLGLSMRVIDVFSIKPTKSKPISLRWRYPGWVGVFFCALLIVAVLCGYYYLWRIYHADRQYKSATVYQHWGDIRRAEELFLQAIELNSFEPRYRDDYNRMYIDIILDLTNKKQPYTTFTKKVIENSNQTIKKIPQHSYAYFAKGMALYLDGNIDEAIKAYKEAVKYNPFNADMHNNLGVALRDMGDLAGAEREFLQAVRLTAGRPQAIKNLLNTYLLGGKYKEAEEFVSWALENYRNVGVFEVLAWYYHQKNDMQQVRNILETIVTNDDLGPNHEPTWQNLLILYMYEFKDLEKARFAALRLLQINPHNSYARQVLSQL